MLGRTFLFGVLGAVAGLFFLPLMQPRTSRNDLTVELWFGIAVVLSSAGIGCWIGWKTGPQFLKRPPMTRSAAGEPKDDEKTNEEGESDGDEEK
jgi:hypothetical protein